MFNLLKANQAQPVKKHTDSLVNLPHSPLKEKKKREEKEKRFVRSYLI